MNSKSAPEAGTSHRQSGFHITSPCGRSYFVARQAVLQDYAEFLRDNDSLSMETALEKAGSQPAFLDTWFFEQFNWSDVERLGLKTADADEEAVRNALNFYRSYAGTGPANDVVVVA